MTITKFTFFSPNGDNYPVTSNADGKLYMMLTGMTYGTVRVRHWSTPLNTALNRVYLNTSVVVGGRYFELTDHSVALLPNTTNYIHAVIDLSTPLDPVAITVETANNSNTTDINNNSGTLKRLIETVTTNASSVMASSLANQAQSIDSLTVNSSISYPTTQTTLSSTNVTGITIVKSGNVCAIRMVGTNISGISNGGYFGTIPAGYRPSVEWHTSILTSASASYRVIVGTDGGLRAAQDIPANMSWRSTITYIL